tara:strand:- start:346 stop:546 length:201 start_codon:yes stop_codon:yes gene_type:complete
MKNLLILEHKRGLAPANGQDQAAGGSVRGASKKDDMEAVVSGNRLAFRKDKATVSDGASTVSATLQ